MTSIKELRAIGALCVEFGAKLCQTADAQETGDGVRFEEVLREVIPLVVVLSQIVANQEMATGVPHIKDRVQEMEKS